MHGRTDLLQRTADHRGRVRSVLSATGRRPLAATGYVTRYGASVAGVAVVTWLIGLVLPRYHVGNISMTYLLLVLALAVFAGRGPAIVASVLSFLAFDWFFIPPVGHITVNDPQEWLALFLFLVVAIITGQLAAGLRRRAEEARRRASEISTLYELSIAILGDARLEHVLHVIVARLRATLGLCYAAVLMLEPPGVLVPVAEDGEPLSESERQEYEVGAHWALDAVEATGQYATPGGARVTRRLDGQIGAGERLLGVYLPVDLGGGRHGILVAHAGLQSPTLTAEARRLLWAFAAQTGLAAGRARLAEEEERARTAAESERMKSIFLASISHDLRTPLTAIKTAAAALRQANITTEDNPHAELAAGIESEADRLNRLVGNLLEMSRIEASGLPPARTPEDLSEVIGTTVNRLEPVLRGRPLSVEIPDDLPLIPLDAAQMDRVLGNLLENAVKFSPSGSAIRLAVSMHPGEVEIRVHNLAPPIPEAQQRRIFDKFYRFGVPAAGQLGTGLGLAISRGIVEAHGGRIWTENDAGGVSFVMTLPLESAEPIRENSAPADAAVIR